MLPEYTTGLIFNGLGLLAEGAVVGALRDRFIEGFLLVAFPVLLIANVVLVLVIWRARRHRDD
jgi:hypothetical protein